MAANPRASSLEEDVIAVSEEDVLAMDLRVAATSVAQRAGGDSEMSEMKLYVDDEVPVAGGEVPDSIEHVPDAVEHVPVASDEVSGSVE
jgi:hypothetical protein